jgi:hypothetical protein
MGFPRINLAQIETSLVAKGQITTVARNGSRADSVIGGIGSQSRDAHLRRMALSEKQPQLYPKHEQDHGCAAGDQPPDVKTRGRMWGGFRHGRSRRYAIAVRQPAIDRPHKPVATPRHSFHKSGILRRVSECVTKPLNGGIETVVEVNKGVGRPQSVAKIIAGHYFSRPLQQ